MTRRFIAIKVLNQTFCAEMEVIPSRHTKMNMFACQTIYLAIKCG